ncbi:MAG: DNRLRE domain-containing protein [Planctomycetota bacterium]|jgi:hypothetical protein
MGHHSPISRWTLIALLFTLVLTSAFAAAEEKNLLLNPGAEQGKNQLPSAWYAAKISADGLRMCQATDQAYSGKASLVISNQHEYELPTSNNWAQSIQNIPKGKTIRLSGFVKTEDADAVNVCVQYWDIKGKNMLAFASTPILRGDQDWMLVQSRPIVIPTETASIIVRAALTGKGKAWFDDLELVVVDLSEQTKQIQLPEKSTTSLTNDLVGALPGKLVRSAPITKDCMILSYIPRWAYGKIDNLAVANNGGGVRTLIDWPAIPFDEAKRSDRRFIIAYYSRKTTFSPPADQIQAYELLRDWPERTSWEQQPTAALKPSATFDFVPDKGWKLFDITPLVRNQAKSKRKRHGMLLRFAHEDHASKTHSGYSFVSGEGTGQWESFKPKLLIVESRQASTSQPTTFPPDTPGNVDTLRQDKVYRGVAFLSSNIGRDITPEEIWDFIESCRIDFVVIDFSWITHHWERTDMKAVEELASRFQLSGIKVAVMYRPRALSSADADIHFARNSDGTINKDHLHLCFAHEDSVKWGVQWGNRLLQALPSINSIIIYNLLAPCRCDRCKNNEGAVHATKFLQHCRSQWKAIRTQVQIGHVGQAAEYADQVDFFCPFLCVNRKNDSPVDTAALLEDVKTSMSNITNKPVIPLIKTNWGSATNNTTEDIINTIESYCCNQTGFILWYYAHLFHGQEERYDANAIRSALMGRPAPGNDPTNYVYFESKESQEGRPPEMTLSLSNGDRHIAISKDVLLISYLANDCWGGHKSLSISMNDSNRALLAFAVPKLAEGVSLTKAEIALDMKQSPNPVTFPFKLGIYEVTEEWDEQKTTWNTQPDIVETPVQTVTIDPAPSTVRIDVTPIVQAWLTGKKRNEGILLKVYDPIKGKIRGVPEITYPCGEDSIEKLPWPHQSPDLNNNEIDRLNHDVWVINDFSLYQADEKGERRYFHGGLDIVLDNGTRIYAMKDGWVKSVRGSTITIADACSGIPSYGWEYTHLGNFQVKVGEFVKKGMFIGEISFKGLPHIHLTKVFSKGTHWVDWRYMCMPNGHFTYVDKQPPVIKTPFYFFRNNSNEKIQPTTSGNIILKGEVDIVVAMREQGHYARSKENSFGDRLGVAKIEYEINPVSTVYNSPIRWPSFDFTSLRIKSGYVNSKYNTTITKAVYKHWTLFEDERTSGNQNFSYYVITNCPTEKSPDELTSDDVKHCWNTAVLDQNGKAVFPDGEYDIIVRAFDYVGNSSQQTMRVSINNRR